MDDEDDVTAKAYASIAAHLERFTSPSLGSLLPQSQEDQEDEEDIRSSYQMDAMEWMTRELSEQPLASPGLETPKRTPLLERAGTPVMSNSKKKDDNNDEDAIMEPVQTPFRTFVSKPAVREPQTLTTTTVSSSTSSSSTSSLVDRRYHDALLNYLKAKRSLSHRMDLEQQDQQLQGSSYQPSTLYLCILWTAIGHGVHALVRCYSIFDCEDAVRKGSECVNGFCTNPYHAGGCLANYNKDHYKVRTCTSEDPPSSAEKGYCQPSKLGYTEVRVSSQNWEAVFFISWILQIILSELMDVPVTIETSRPNLNVDFYDINSSFDYGGANDWDAMRRADQVKDCRTLKDSEEYTSCTHVIPEVWSGRSAAVMKLWNEQVIEAPGGLGALGEQMWFMRRKTAREHPAFLSYLGLQGEENREKVAEVFKRPTTWEEYCKFVSENNCETPDKFAQRPPGTEDENGMYFVQGSYTGYFRATEENQCNINPNCTGHIVDYPCGWQSYVAQQALHLGIAVKSNGKQPGSNGYSYGEMVQIWNAANATDSDVLMLWWRPEALYQQFLGTDSDFLSVTFPPPTQTCVDNRINPEDRCGDDPALRFGDPRGSCAEAPHSLIKLITTALRDISFDSDKPEALHSPAYEAVKNFRISELQVGEIFERWFQKDTDKFGLDPRDATCEWVLDNLDILKTFVQRTHLRVVVDDDDVYKQPFFYVALALACLAIFTTISTSILVFIQRQKTAIRYAQIEFLFLLLIGLLLVSIGSLMTALPPTNTICVAIGWFINFGYTLELVPLIVKIAAINRLMVATQQMRRVKLTMASLFGAVLFFCVLVFICLVLWTTMDPPRKDEEFELTENESENGETVVKRSYYCGSDQEVWNFLGVSWQALLLLCASVLAFQTRKVREDLNETKVLAMMIYSQFVLVILRAITYVLDGSLNHADVAAARSLIFSFDALTTIGIYFAPKLLQKEGYSETSGNDKEAPLPLSVHKWSSRYGSNRDTSSGSGRRESSNSDPGRMVGRLWSLRESSMDSNANSEWERNEPPLEVLHEEASTSSGFD